MPTTATARRRDPVPHLIYLPLLMLAWGLWLYHLSASDLTFDEAATYYVAHRPLLDILRYLLHATREHPPLYYLLIHLWMRAAGAGEFSLRVFSVGAGMLLIALTTALASRRSLLTWLAVHALLSPGPRATTAGLWGGLSDSLPPYRQVLRLLGKMLLSPDQRVHYQLLYCALLLVTAGTLLLLWRRLAAGWRLSASQAGQPLPADQFPIPLGGGQ